MVGPTRELDGKHEKRAGAGGSRAHLNLEEEAAVRGDAPRGEAPSAVALLCRDVEPPHLSLPAPKNHFSICESRMSRVVNEHGAVCEGRVWRARMRDVRSLLRMLRERGRAREGVAAGVLTRAMPRHPWSHPVITPPTPACMRRGSEQPAQIIC